MHVNSGKMFHQAECILQQLDSLLICILLMSCTAFILFIQYVYVLCVLCKHSLQFNQKNLRNFVMHLMSSKLRQIY